MRRTSKRLGQVLESYEQAALRRDPFAGAPLTKPRLAPSLGDVQLDDTAAHEAYREGIAEQAAVYLEELRAGDRVLMHFEHETLSPIDGGPRDIDVLDLLRELCRRDGFSFESEPLDDIGVHLTPACGAPPAPLRRRPR